MNIITELKEIDKFGYYHCAGRKIYSKQEFMDVQVSTRSSFSWHFNDEEFSSYDWTQEPTESLDELYKQRAQQLRDKYDYLVLHFSGGTDSTTILDAFVDNDIHLDEVVNFGAKNDSQSNQGIENKILTQHKMNFLRKKYPKIKFTNFDYTQYIDNWSKVLDEYSKEYLYLFGHLTLPNVVVVDMLPKFEKRWRDMIDRGTKIAFITGAEKPMIRVKDDKWIFNFHDGFIGNRMSVLRQIYDDGSFGSYEFFYWSGDLPKLVIKQSHTIMNHYKNDKKKFLEDSYEVNKDYGRTFNPTKFSPLVYPKLKIISRDEDFYYGADNRSYFIRKNKRLFYGNRDEWYFKSNLESKEKFGNMIKSLKNKLSDEWMNKPGFLEAGIKNVMSKDYFLC